MNKLNKIKKMITGLIIISINEVRCGLGGDMFSSGSKSNVMTGILHTLPLHDVYKCLDPYSLRQFKQSLSDSRLAKELLLDKLITFEQCMNCRVHLITLLRAMESAYPGSTISEVGSIVSSTLPFFKNEIKVTITELCKLLGHTDITPLNAICKKFEEYTKEYISGADTLKYLRLIKAAFPGIPISRIYKEYPLGLSDLDREHALSKLVQDLGDEHITTSKALPTYCANLYLANKMTHTSFLMRIESLLQLSIHHPSFTSRIDTLLNADLARQVKAKIMESEFQICNKNMCKILETDNAFLDQYALLIPILSVATFDEFFQSLEESGIKNRIVSAIRQRFAGYLDLKPCQALLCLYTDQFVKQEITIEEYFLKICTIFPNLSVAAIINNVDTLFSNPLITFRIKMYLKYRIFLKTSIVMRRLSSEIIGILKVDTKMNSTNTAYNLPNTPTDNAIVFMCHTVGIDCMSKFGSKDIAPFLVKVQNISSALEKGLIKPSEFIGQIEHLCYGRSLPFNLLIDQLKLDLSTEAQKKICERESADCSLQLPSPYFSSCLKLSILHYTSKYFHLNEKGAFSQKIEDYNPNKDRLFGFLLTLYRLSPYSSIVDACKGLPEIRMQTLHVPQTVITMVIKDLATCLNITENKAGELNTVSALLELVDGELTMNLPDLVLL